MMCSYPLKILPYGDGAVLIQWPSEVSKSILADITRFRDLIHTQEEFRNIESVPAYNSLTLIFSEPYHLEYIRDSLHHLYTNPDGTDRTYTPRHWHIPVCYTSAYGIDLEAMSKYLKIPIDTIVDKHTSGIYTVYCIGFQPGFLYLGGLDPTLHMPRKDIPRLKINKGDVGIAGKQTGIYPQVSPGGWNIIGNTPICLFDIQAENPCPIQVGDSLSFYSITVTQHEDMRKQALSLTSCMVPPNPTES